MSLLAYLMEKLRSTPEGSGTLLDSVMILYGGGISDGNLHDHYDLPCLVAGGGGGALKGGRHLEYPRGTPMQNLASDAARQVGVIVEKLGDSTGRLEIDGLSRCLAREEMDVRLKLDRDGSFGVLCSQAAASASPTSGSSQAAKAGDAAAVRALLPQKVAVNAIEADGTTALQWAAARGDRAMTDLLIKAGADVNRRQPARRDAAVGRLRIGGGTVVARLLDAGADAQHHQAVRDRRR